MHLMTLRTKIILIIIAVVTALATVFAATYQPRRVETIARPLVKIDAYLPLSGPNAHLGLAARHAMEQVLKEAELKSRYKYEILFEDIYANSTASDNTAKAVITFTTSPEPRAELTIMTQEPNKFIIHSPYKETADLFVKDLSRRNIKNIGLLTMASGEYRRLAKTFKDALPESYELNGAVFQPEQKDFSILINLLRNNDTDLFVLVGAPAETDALISQLHDNGVSNFNISTLYSVDLSSEPKLYENTRSVGSKAGGYDTALPAKAVKLLIEAYEKNFKKDYLPTTQMINDDIAEKHARDNIIAVPSAVKIVRDGKITIPQE